MSRQCGCCRPWRKVLWALLGLSAACLAAGSRAFADQPGDCRTPIIGCGKGQAMAAAFNRGDPPGIETREAMGDTDVLNVALDIEASNLNTGSDSCTLAGTCATTIKSKSAALSQFTFRLRNQYTISSATVTDGANTVPVTVATQSTTTRVATLNRTYGMDEVFTLTIVYGGTSVDAGGFGSINVATSAGGTVVETLSEPYYSYAWWPAKDGDVGLPGDNSDKFTLQMSVIAPNNYVVPSNGLLQGVDALGGGRNRYRWASNYQIPSYLVCFAASNYHTYTLTYNYPAGPYNPAGSMPVLLYLYPGNDDMAGNNRAAWGNCLNMLATYRGIYGEYPFVNEKYGIYNFNFGGGMEHQSMTGEGTFSESVTAHELGHQWWGDNVTCKTWSDIWVNEGFADYTECLWAERKAGGIDTAAYLSALSNRRPTSNGSGDSVYVYPSAISSGGVNRIFSNDYTYYKGGWVLHMLRHAVGDNTFFNGILPAYRTQFTGSAATTDDFSNVCSTVTGKDMTPFFNQWIYNRGAPSYQYGWQSTNVAGQNYLLMKITQTQTATSGSPPQVLSVYQMPVDVSATISGSPQTKTVQNTARTQWFVVPVSAAVTALSFDPAPYILRGSATSVAYAAGPPKIVATSPLPGASITQLSSPSQITVTFHTPVNCAAANFTLVGNTTGPQTLTLVSGANVNPAVLNLAGPLPADTYTLTVTTGVTAVNSSMVLDGEIANPTSPSSLPSGDGVAGGNAVLQFTITPCAAPADIDQNCARDQNDVDIFVQVLLGSDLDAGHVSRSDLNSSGAVDGDDIGPFTAAWLGL